MKKNTPPKKLFHRIISDQKGSILLISYMIIVVFLGFGAALMIFSAGESRAAEKQRATTVAFYVAEAGIESALYELRQDFVGETSPDWADGDINGAIVGPDTANFYSLPLNNTSLNGGTCSVQLKNVSGRDDVWVRSTGTVQGIDQTVQIYVKMVNISLWDNAIFAGAGAAGAMINGNVDIRGSVHVLGTGLADGDFAMDLGGDAQLVGNNYKGVSSDLLAKVPALETVSFNGETIETLNAELRVKNGIVGLSGSATVGESDYYGNSTKETVDGVYVTDGWGGNAGAGAVFSDNGTNNEYDLGDDISFPLLSDPYPDNPSQTVEEHFLANALILSNELNNLDPTSTFSYSDANGSISMDGSGNLTIDGRVYISGDFSISKKGAAKSVYYTGSGTILSGGDIVVNTNFVTAGNNSFPSNIIGFMTPNTISVDASGLDIMGIFYAEDQVTVAKQTDIMGTIVSNYFDMGTNVPSIFQVPDTVNHLPAGMIGNQGITWYMVSAWQKL